MGQLFALEKINTGRQLELDIARGLAVLFMVLIHFQEYFLKLEYSETSWALTVDFWVACRLLRSLCF